MEVSEGGEAIKGESKEQDAEENKKGRCCMMCSEMKNNFEKMLRQKEEQLKRVTDQVHKIQNENEYRKEVVRLEGLMEQSEIEIRAMKNELRTGEEKINMLEKKIRQMIEEKESLRSTSEVNIKAKEEKMKILEVNMKVKEEEMKTLKDRHVVSMKSKEDEVETLSNSVERKLEKIRALEKNASFLMDENTILKNTAKVSTKDHTVASKTEGEIMEAIQTLSITMEKLEAYTSKNFERLDTDLAEYKKERSIQTQQQNPQQQATIQLPAPAPPQPPLPLPSAQILKSQEQSKSQQKSQDKGNYLWQEIEKNSTCSLVVPKSTNQTNVNSAAPTGHGSYSEDERNLRIENIKERRAKRESSTLIIASSITRDIKKKEFSENYRYGNARFHEFKGKRAKDIMHYMEHHIEEENPHTVMFVAGGNDLPNRDLPDSKIAEVANYLINGGKKCKEQFGVTDVLISSVLPRSDALFQGNRHRLNIILRELCEENGFMFVENGDIVLRAHGHHDGVHLNKDGSELLHRNLLFALNNTR